MVQIRELLFLMQRETLEKCAERRSCVGMGKLLVGDSLPKHRCSGSSRKRTTLAP